MHESLSIAITIAILYKYNKIAPLVAMHCDEIRLNKTAIDNKFSETNSNYSPIVIHF